MPYPPPTTNLKDSYWRSVWKTTSISTCRSCLNGTISENQEYLRLLGYYVQGVDALPLPLYQLMDLWLEDQLGHALLLRNVLDPVESGLAEKAAGFARTFQAHMIKNRAIRGYLRFLQQGFPAQRQFAREVSQTVTAFYQLVWNCILLFKGKQLLSRTALPFLEHYLPETCYFLGKLAAYVKDMEQIEPCPLRKPSG